MTTIDILVITYNRPTYTRLALERLLDTCDSQMRVWLWHNGTHDETLKIATSYATHPCVARFHHSPNNEQLRVPTNWLWENSVADLVAKVDDDCLMPDNWGDIMRAAHRDNPKFGAIACWHFPAED